MALGGRPKKSRAHLPATVGAFLDKLAKSGAVHSTHASFESDLMDVCAFLIKKGKDINTATTDDLQDFLNALGRRKKNTASGKCKLSFHTIDHHIGTLRRFFEFLIAEGIRTDDPMFSIITTKRRRQKVLSEKQVSALISTAQQQGTAGIRLAAQIEILYTTNLSVDDLMSLPVSAIDIENRCLTVEGRSGSINVVSLPEPAQQVLKAYMDIRDRFLPSDEYKTGIQGQWLFPGSAKTGHMNSSHFVELLQKLSREAGLGSKGISTHALQYAYARHRERHQSVPSR